MNLGDGLSFLADKVKQLYKVSALDKNGNILKDEEGNVKMVDLKRRSGRPAHTHPFNTASILKRKKFPSKYVITGLYHDLLEDTHYSKLDLIQILDEYVKRRYPRAYINDPNYINDIVEAVALLTKPKMFNRHEDMPLYIKKIKENDLARIVKVADRISNLTDLAPSDSSTRQKRYIDETEKYFLDLAKDTILEEDMIYALDLAKKTYAVRLEEEKSNKQLPQIIDHYKE